MAELSIANKFYIDNNRDKYSPKELAKQLGITVKVVNDFLAANPPKPVEQPEPPQPPVITTKDLFNRSKNKQAIIMTQAASEKADSTRSTSLSARMQSCTYKATDNG